MRSLFSLKNKKQTFVPVSPHESQNQFYFVGGRLSPIFSVLEVITSGFFFFVFFLERAGKTALSHF